MPTSLAIITAAPHGDQLLHQIIWLFVLAVPIACIAWTVTREEIFREPREFCSEQSKNCKNFVARKGFYLFTCEYCFSHWVTLLFILLTGYRLLLDTWIGYVIGFFAVVFVANLYMSFYARMRVDIRSLRAAAEMAEKEAAVKALQINAASPAKPGL